MIARTETLNASNGGQQTLWLEAKDAGYLDTNSVIRQWLVTDDDRLDVKFASPWTARRWASRNRSRPATAVLSATPRRIRTAAAP